MVVKNCKLAVWLVELTIYRIYSINLPVRLFNFGPMRVGAYSRWRLLFSQHLQQVRTFSISENSKTRHVKVH